MNLCKFVLLFLFPLVCSGYTIRFGVLYDHYIEHLNEVVLASVKIFEETLKAENGVTVSSIGFDLDKNPNIYDDMMSYNLSAVIVAAKKLKCEKIVSLKKRIPFYVVTESVKLCDENDKENGIIYLYPSDTAVLNAMLLATEKYKWRKAMVMGEKNAEFDFTFSSMQQARERGLETLAQEITSDRESLYKTVMIAKTEGIRSFILMCRASYVDVVLSLAEELELTNRNFHWFIPNVFVTPESIEQFVSRGTRISLLHSPIITPLVYKLQADQRLKSSSLSLMNEVVSALTMLAINKTVLACQTVYASGCMPTGDNHTCQANFEDMQKILESSTTSNYTYSKTSTAASSTTAHSLKKRSTLLHESESTRKSKSEKFQGNHFISGSCHKKRCAIPNKKKIPVFVITDNAPSDTKVPHRWRRAVETNETSDQEHLYEIPNSRCLNYKWLDTYLEAIESVIEELYPMENNILNSSDAEGSGVDSTTGKTRIPELQTRIDSCLFTSTHTWSYHNDSCSYDLMKNSEIPLANSLFIIEYPGIEETFQKQAKASGKAIVLNTVPAVVGGYNRNNVSFIATTYTELHIYDVYLPERDLLVGVINHPPWLDWSIDKDGENVFEGFLFDILEQLSNSMNFSYQLLPEYDFVGDILNQDEVERHMINVFDNGSVDFFLHAVSIRGNRLGSSDTVSLSASFQEPKMYLLTKRVEKTESVSFWQFMLPFREESWICFWSSFILVSLLLTYYNKRNPNEYQAISHTFGPNSSPSDHLGILNSLWFNFAVICGQGADIMPISSAAITLTGAWWGFLLLVVSAYTANMTAFMTQVNSGGIQTLDELASQQDFEYGMLESSAMLHYFLPKAKDAPYTTIFKHLHEDEEEFIFQTQADAFDAVLRGNFFLVSEYESVVDALKQSCEFDVRGDGFYNYKFAFPFPKGSVYLPLFNDYIKKLADKGTLAQLEKKWFTLDKKCEAQDVVKNLENQLDIKAFTGMYIFLILGITGGIFVCALETGWIKCGGISGMFGRAGVYELNSERKELQKANDFLEKEFESWDGGWQVWKFMEWKEGEKFEQKPVSVSARPNSKLTKCQICGRTCKEISRSVSKTAIKAPIIQPPIIVHEEKENNHGSSDDSGRESASTGQLTVTEEISSQQQSGGDNETEKACPTEEKREEKHQAVNDVRRTRTQEWVAKETPQEFPKRMTQLLQETVLPGPIPTLPDPPLKFITADVYPAHVPMESLPHMAEGRVESSQSVGSCSHSSLASGTLSFCSDSEESVSTIHPRSPYQSSTSPTRFAESSLTYDWESSLASASSMYTTTSYEADSVCSWVDRDSLNRSRTNYTPGSTFDDYTDDASSDVTVISRRFLRQ